MIGAMGLVAGSAVQAVAMAEVPSGHPAGGAAWIVAGDAQRLQRHVQQAAAVGGVGVVADLAVAAAGGNVGERSGPGPLDLVLVAVAAQFVQR